MQSRTRQFDIAIRATRIVTGLFMLAFVTCHLLNASFGIVSIAAMDAARPYLSGIWFGPVVGNILFLALSLHFLLGLWAIYLRPTLRTNTQDMIQMMTSVCIVPLMATHVLGIMMVERSGIEMTYAIVIKSLWQTLPYTGLIQVTLLVVVWIHGCAGLLNWMRSHPALQNVMGWIYPLAVAIPLAALLGYSEAGRRLLAEAETPASGYGYDRKDSGYGTYGDNQSGTSAYGDTSDNTGYGSYGSDVKDGGYGSDAPQTGYGYGEPSTAGGYGDEPAQPDAPPFDPAFVQWLIQQTIWWSIGAAAAVLLARAARIAFGPKQTVEAIRDGHPLVPERAGLSLLDMLESQAVPHANLCAGRGRCGTCAVRVVASDFPLPEPSNLELRTLVAKGLPEDARLACQLKPTGGHIDVTALYRADYQFADEDDGRVDFPPSAALEPGE